MRNDYASFKVFVKICISAFCDRKEAFWLTATGYVKTSVDGFAALLTLVKESLFFVNKAIILYLKKIIFIILLI